VGVLSIAEVRAQRGLPPIQPAERGEILPVTSGSAAAGQEVSA
jgi:hypothetical protein